MYKVLVGLTILMFISSGAVVVKKLVEKQEGAYYDPSLNKEMPTLKPGYIPSELQDLLPTQAAEKIVSKLQSGKCIVTLFGKKYDFTSVYSEKNPFDCGGDMTKIYQSKYGTDVSKLYYYLVEKPTSVPTTATNLEIDQQNQINPSAFPSNTSVPTIKPKITPKESPEPTEFHREEEREEDED